MRVTFYGDDFTGSTDVMEALSLGGVPTVLFVDPPTPTQLARYPDAEAVGVAGASRAMTPEQMDAHLPEAFATLAGLHAPIMHYKVCSTFDSSPTIGSIGRAIDLAWQQFQPRYVPLVLGAPALGRYVVFGNLFARSGLDSAPYRLDRHPTMSRHPVTPMDEADVLAHLSLQTDRPAALVDVTQLRRATDAFEQALETLLGDGAEVVLFDTIDDTDLAVLGRLLWQGASSDRPLFAVGSSGLAYALTAHWQQQGQPEMAEPAMPGPVDRVAVVSGSLSPVTARQIELACADGEYSAVAADTSKLVRDAEPEIDRLVSEASRVLGAGQSVIVHVGCGPQDPRVAAANEALVEAGQSSGPVIGGAMGRVLARLAEDQSVQRLVVTGGDTSGFAARQMGIEALTFLARMAPGSPLCTAHSRNRAVDGRQVVFKGGQVGWPDFFTTVLRGMVDNGPASSRPFMDTITRVTRGQGGH